MCIPHPDLEPADPAIGTGRCPAGVSLPVRTDMNALNLGILIVDSECRITFAKDYATGLLRSLRGTRTQTPWSADRIHDASPFDKRLRKAISDSDHRAD